jgi:hypothetical protein
MTFAAPMFLLGLALLALPFWLHRLTEQRAERRRFSSLMFMQAGREQRLVRRRLRHPWILLMKLAAIVALVLAFTRPFLPSQAEPGSVERSTLHVIALDTSMSMGLGERWERALEQVDDILSTLGSGDDAMLVTADSDLRVVAEPADAGVIRRALPRALPGQGRLAFAGLLRNTASTARAVSDSGAALHIHLVSDFQASAAPTRFADLPAGEGAQFTLHDVAPRSTEDNWAIEQIRTFAGAREGGVEVVVRSYASTEREVSVDLDVNGEQVGTARLHVPAGGRASHQFDGVEGPRGDSPITAVLRPGDGLATDDERGAVMANRAAARVLVMTGEASGQSALYIDAALAASPQLGFRAEPSDPESWNELAFGDFPLVILADPPLLSSVLSERLASYVEGGGAVLVFLGEGVERSGRVPLTAHRVERARALDGAEFRSVAEADETHPVSASVARWKDVSFYDHLSIATLDGDRVLARLEGGDPLLVEHAFGLGRVLIFASALDRDWSNFSMEPEFTPWMVGAVRYLAGLRRTALEERVIGEAFNISSAGVQLFDPRGEKVLSLAQTLGGSDVILDRLGFYEMKVAGERRLIAVNCDLRESDPRGMSDAMLERWQAVSPQVRPTQRPSISQGSARELWPWLLMVLLVLMLAESMAGNSLLRRRVAI